MGEPSIVPFAVFQPLCAICDIEVKKFSVENALEALIISEGEVLSQLK